MTRTMPSPRLWYLVVCGLVATAAAAGAAFGAEHPALVQNAGSRPGIGLDGRWSAIVDPYETGYYNHRYEPDANGYFRNARAQSPADLIEYNFATARKLNVPGDWNSQDEKLFLYEGTVWYQRDFVLRKLAARRYVIHFGAVNYRAIVYLNGQRVGEHEGGFTPFQFDVTDQVLDGDNFVVVKVDNRRERDQVPTVNTDWWNYGGITRQVRLLELPSAYVQDYAIHLKDGAAEAIAIAGWVQVVGTPAKTLGRVQLDIPELGVATAIALDESGYGRFSIAAQPALWSPATPKLYTVRLGTGEDLVEDRIGFRSIAVRGEDILLNGKPVFLKGISIHEESPLHPGRAWSEADASALLAAARELGCNFVRLAHYPHNEHMLRLADEMGLLVWSEIPVYWTVRFDSPAVYAKAERQLSEMIARDRNRASVIFWSMANETPISQERLAFIGKLASQARGLDGTRLISAALDTQSEADGARVIDDPLAAVVDVIGINSYCGWYGGTPASCAGLKWLSKYRKPVIMSEFGAGAVQGRHGDAGERWTEEYQAEVYRNNLAMIDRMSFLRGITPWILRDFRSPRRPLAGIQDYWNRKGMLGDNGNRKQAWYVLQQYYAGRPD